MPGPTLLVVGGMHGNEPAGIVAARRVLDRLRRLEGPFRGDLVALVGNTRALDRGVRYIDKDLNRQWLPEIVERLRASGSPGCAEDAEMLELLEHIDTATVNARGPVIFVDMHTSSAEGAPFVTIGDTLRNRTFALNFPLPVILGLEEQIDGALLEYMNNLGYTTFGFEGGQHQSEAAIAYKEAALLLALVFSGAIDREQLEEFDALYDMLDSGRLGQPRIVEVLYRHAIVPEDEYVMQAGFTNFDRVKKGQLLGMDRWGLVRSPIDGMVLLPLYQGQGSDGFFICRRIEPLWLGVSRRLRGLRLDRFAHVLPGVRKHPRRLDTLIVDTRTARFFPLQTFHLLGYRKLRWDGPTLLVTRRRFDDPHET
jgi:succinylglutamate desuccinylase